VAYDRLMSANQFQDFFTRVLNEPKFRRDLESKGVGALKDYGLQVEVPAEIEKQLNAIPRLEATSRCGVCGVCGACSLCGEINLGSGSAFLWATFFLGDATLVAQT